MPEGRPRTSRGEASHPIRVESSTQAGRGTLGWILVVAALFAFVYLPVFFSQDFNQWSEVTDVTDVFGVTPTWATDVNIVTDVPELELHVEVGHVPAAGQIYQHQTCDAFPFQVDDVVRLPGANACNPGPDLGPLASACCGSPEGWYNEATGTIHFAATAPGSDLIEVLVEATPPHNTATVTVDAAATLVSATLDFWSGGYVATAYDQTNNRVNVYTRTEAGSWTFLKGVACDSPFSNYHWGATVEPNGVQLSLVCRNGGPVTVTLIDLTNGNNVWVHPIDNAPASGDFYYQGCNPCGDIEFPDQSTGPALGCSSSSPDGQVVCLFGPVDGPAPPPFSECASFPDAAPDRQAFACDGPILYSHGADPDGSGAVTRIVNCGVLDGPCIATETEDNSRDVDFAGFAPRFTEFGGVVREVSTDGLVVVEGDNPGVPLLGTSVVRYGTLAVPFYFDTFESGDFRFWGNVVGELESPPTR